MKTSSVLKKLRVYMTANQLSETSIAQAIGVEPQTVGYWLAGTHQPRPQNVQRILAAFDLSDPYGAQSREQPSSSGFEGEVLSQLATLRRHIGSLEATIEAASELYLEQAAAMEAQRAIVSCAHPGIGHSCGSSNPRSNHHPSSTARFACDGTNASNVAA